MRTVLRTLCSCLSVGVLLLPMLAEAAVQVTGTRVIYPAGEREIIVRLTNSSNRPALVQSWLDAGDAAMKPGVEKLPFVILPPLVRVDANKGQALRIAYVGGTLPQDRESVFWLNVLDVPPKLENSSEQNVVQLAFRTRLKLFYRPANLQSKPETAVEGLKWSVIPQGKAYALHVANDSAYHISFSSILLKAGSKTYSVDAGAMVAPHTTQGYPLEGLKPSLGSGSVAVKWIDDFGASRERSYELVR